MKRKPAYLTAVTSIAALAAATTAWSAVPITCPNASFEDPVIGTEGTGVALPGAPTGWTGGYYDADVSGDPVPGSWTGEEGYRGAYNPDGPPSGVDAPFEATDGSNTAYCEAYAGYLMALSQTLSEVLLPGLTYDLSVNVANPNVINGGVASVPYRIELLAGDTTVDSDSGPTTGLDTWTAASLSYTAPAAGDPLIGQPLTIRIMAGDTTTDLEVHFDEVALTRSELLVPIAEPGGPYSVAIPSGSLSLDGSASLPPDGQTLTTWEWDLDGDGDFTDDPVTGETPASIPYATLTGTYGMVEGPNTIKLRVTDNSLPTPLTSAVVDGTVTLFEPQTTFTGPSKSNGDNWNVDVNWDNGIPSGAIDAFIDPGKFVTAASAATPLYSGDLSIGANANLQIGYTDNNQQNYNALGTPGTTVISMDAGSGLYLSRTSGTHIVPEIQMLGDIGIKTGQSTNTAPDLYFDHGINGAYTLTLYGKGDSDIFLTAANGFSGFIADPLDGSGFDINCSAAGSLGNGDVTILPNGAGAICAKLSITAADVMADTATLSLNGDSAATMLTTNSDDTIGRLIINGVQQLDGTYGQNGNGSVDYQVDWLSGAGILTVTGPTSAYWDSDGDNPGAGGTTPAGTWGVDAYWSGSAAGDAATAAWNAGDTATFAAGTDATGTYTATVSGTQDIGGLSVEEGTVTLSGGTALRMTMDSMMRVGSGLTATVSTPVSDDGAAWQLAKGSDGALVLGGTNTYTGVTNLQGGTLSVGTLANAGVASNIGQYATAGAEGLLLFGGTLQYTGGTATTDRGFTLKGDSTIDVSSAGAALTLGACEAITSSGTLTVTGGAGSSLAMGQFTVVKGVSPTLAPAAGVSMTVASVHSDSRYPLPIGTLTLGGTTTGNVVTGNFTKGNTQWEPGMHITKSGSGTWTLAGSVNTGGQGNVGKVTVNDGTLLVTGSIGTVNSVSVNGPGVLGGTGTITRATTLDGTGGLAPGTSAGTLTFTNNLDVSALAGGGGGTLAFELDALAATSDLIAVSGTLTIGTGALRFTDFTFTDLGGLELGTYTLMTSGTLSGTVDAANASGMIGSLTGTLQVNGNDLELNVTSGATSAYATWASTHAPGQDPDEDYDGDGVSNELEFVLGGTKDTNDLGKLPVVAEDGTNMTFTFKRDQQSVDGTTVVTIEVSTDLSIWDTSPSPYAVPDGATAGPPVTVVKDSPAAGTDTVTLTVTMAPDAKKFARLKVVVTP